MKKPPRLFRSLFHELGRLRDFVARLGKATVSNRPSRLSLEGLEDRVTPAVTITATKSVDLAVAHPGDTLTYTVTIADTGTTDATGVQLLDAIDPNATFVANSVKLSPMAVSHSYSSVGNTPLSTSAGIGLLAGVHDL